MSAPAHGQGGNQTDRQPGTRDGQHHRRLRHDPSSPGLAVWCQGDSFQPSLTRADGHILPRTTGSGRCRWSLAAANPTVHHEVMTMTALAPRSLLPDRQGGPPEAVLMARPWTRLVGVRHIAQIFAVSIAEGHRELIRLPDFPPPAGEISDHVLWSREEITGWHLRRGLRSAQKTSLPSPKGKFFPKFRVGDGDQQSRPLGQ